jgi:hypothetical protein
MQPFLSLQLAVEYSGLFSLSEPPSDGPSDGLGETTTTSQSMIKLKFISSIGSSESFSR